MSLALLQLHRPDAANQTMIQNLLPTKLNCQLQIPNILRSYLQPHDDAPKFTINVTPTYNFVDLHVDRGMEGLAITIEHCQKLWFLWPPTPGNLREFERVLRKGGGGRMVACNLDDGIITYTDSTMAIYVPAGWIHATLTLSGGFLAGITFVAAESIFITAQCFAMDLRHTPDEFEENCQHYIDALEVSLRTQDVAIELQAVESWVTLQSALQRLVTKKCKALADTMEIWSSFLAGDITWQACPCKWEGESFAAHFLSKHLYFLAR